MIAALAIGRAGSSGFPGKNVTEIVGRPLSAYPILAAANARLVDRVFVSTDSDEIAEIGRQYGAEIIERPAYLATKEALGGDAFKHGYEYIRDLVAPEELEAVVLLFCNSATITPGIIDEGVEAIRADPTLDSAITASRYNMWSPLRAHKIVDGLLEPYIDYRTFDDANCDRDAQGDVYFPDMSAFVVRPQCFDYSYGIPPWPWIGRKVLPLKQWGGLDVDYDWQMPQIEFWLRKHGFTETETPYETADAEAAQDG